VICLENNNCIFSDEYKEMIENIGQITKNLSPKFFTVCQNNLKLNSILKTNTNPEDIDLIIVATITSDYSTPSTACLVQGALGCVTTF